MSVTQLDIYSIISFVPEGYKIKVGKTVYVLSKYAARYITTKLSELAAKPNEWDSIVGENTVNLNHLAINGKETVFPLSVVLCALGVELHYVTDAVEV